MNSKNSTSKENSSECIEQGNCKDKTEWKKLEFKKRNKLKSRKETLVKK